LPLSGTVRNHRGSGRCFEKKKGIGRRDRKSGVGRMKGKGELGKRLVFFCPGKEKREKSRLMESATEGSSQATKGKRGRTRKRKSKSHGWHVRNMETDTKKPSTQSASIKMDQEKRRLRFCAQNTACLGGLRGTHLRKRKGNLENREWHEMEHPR